MKAQKYGMGRWTRWLVVLVGIGASPPSSAAGFRLDQLELKAPIRYDLKGKRHYHEISANRLQFQGSLRYGLTFFESDALGTLRLRGLIGTGGSFTSQWNTLLEPGTGFHSPAPVHVRQIYVVHDRGDIRSELGVIPPVKSKGSNTSLDKDGWIRGGRVVLPVLETGQLEFVTGAIDHLDEPNAFQTWDEWNYAEVEWTHDWTSGFRTELSPLYLDEQAYFRGEVRQELQFLKGYDIELAGEIIRNLTTPVWAIDVSLQADVRAPGVQDPISLIVEYAHIPYDFGLLGELSNDFFSLGHMLMVAAKGSMPTNKAYSWFLKGYLTEYQFRVNAGLQFKSDLAARWKK